MGITPVYRVSFSIKFYGDEPYFSKGFGYKFSKDSIVFKSKKKFNKRLNPFYSSLFMEHKVYSDFEFNEYLTDSTWNRYSTYYTAKGGEKFITFGQFAFKPDEKVVEQVEFIRRSPSMEKTNKFIQSGKSVFIKRIDSVVIDRKNYLSENYYLLDDVVVERV